MVIYVVSIATYNVDHIFMSCRQSQVTPCIVSHVIYSVGFVRFSSLQMQEVSHKGKEAGVIKCLESG